MMKLYFKPRFKRSPLRAKRYISKNKKHTLLYRGVCVLIVVLIITVLIDARVRPIIKTAAGNVVKNKISIMINNTVNDYMSSEDVLYSELVTLTKSDSGDIKAITLNSANTNRFKAEISERIATKTESSEKIKIVVPWGTLTGSSVLNGRGTKVNIRASVYGYAVSDVESTFESAGVNQTKHSVYITVSVSVGAYIGTYYVNEKVKTKLLVAETVIVGTVPDTYLKVN